jgi:flagellar transcriptional activator FlhD
VLKPNTSEQADKESRVELAHMMDEIQEINLRYMLLAQRMLREDRAAASFRLGLSQEVAGALADLTPSQMLKMAACGVLLPRFRFDDRSILDLLANYRSEREMTNTHAAILVAAQPAATM